MSEDKIMKVLEHTSIFKGVPQNEMKRIVEETDVYEYEKGERICQKNDIANAVYIVESGRVSESAIDDFFFEKKIKQSKRYYCFGEFGVLLDDGYHTTVKAINSVKVLVIPKKIFASYFWGYPSVVKEILNQCSIRLQRSVEKSIALTKFNSEGRLAYMLLMLNRDKNVDGYIHLTQESIALRLGLARQTVSKIVNDWQEREIVQIKRGKLAILNTSKLEAIALKCAKDY